ncbi:hypothetical protein WA026_006417 [Henosepilachna vigintioctopunctata]|uniref:Uncharacterized protein n=1 Tax=Henosepilachna vigintioctopunctata TaxID=420089 RepID=A0AAW1TQJ2_9CUCU
MNKKNKKKGKAKSRSSSGKRSKSLSKKSKNDKITEPSTKYLLTENELSTGDVNSLSVVGNNILLAKPEKLEKAEMSMWSEPSRCCVCCIDRSTVPVCDCNGISKNIPQCIEDKSDQNDTEYQDKTTLCIGMLTKERDHYKEEFERLMKLFEKLNDSNENQERVRAQCRACDKKDQMIEYLQKENQILAKEKYFLMSRLEEGGNRLDMQSPGGACQKLPCKRTERERDLLKFDVQRLEEENDCLRDKFKATNESKTRDYVKFQEQRIEYENMISKLDGERRELMKAQGTRRIAINALEEKVQTYSDLLRVEQNETQRIRDQYYQLKKLHDQCDKALLDTQAQLMEVEAELLNCHNKKSTTDRKQSTYEYLGVDEIIEVVPEPKMVQELTASQRKSDEIANNETISRLKEENAELKKELSEKEKEVIACKEKYRTSEMMLVEKINEITNLQNENFVKSTEMKELQNNIEERDSMSRVLHAEVEHLNKETNALVNTNHQQQEDIQQYKVQISVAMETINELENKVKQLEGTIEKYEKQTQLMKLDLTRFESLAAARDREMDELLAYKLSLETTKGQMYSEAEEYRKKICGLECQCQKLKMNLMAESSKDNLISELNAKLAEIKAEKDALEKECTEISKKATKMENKLFQCICTICDNSQEKCTMLKCFLNENENLTSRGGTFVNVMVTGKDVATQVCICDGRCKKSKAPLSSHDHETLPVDKSSYKDDGDIYPIYEDPAITLVEKQHTEKVEDKVPPNFLYNFDDNQSMDVRTLSSYPRLQESYMNPAPYFPSEIVKEFVMDESLMPYRFAQTDLMNKNK